ncbi:MAG: hypothetical protein MUP74_01155 [Desulfobacterales bacterium]|nr:hypothetical protein [Desulfobacterales bacterium]
MRLSSLSAPLPSDPAAYLVGGAVRDLLLGRSPIDLDIAVAGDPEVYASQIARAACGRVVVMGGPGQMIWRVLIRGAIYDVAALNGPSIEADLRLRDFTVNALAISLKTGAEIDCLGGRRDLNAGIIRMVAPSAFRNDPLRLLRAFRIAAGLDFAIEPETLGAIKRHAPLIATSAGERIRSELFALLRMPRSHAYLVQLAESGLLAEILAEIGIIRGTLAETVGPGAPQTFDLKAFGRLESLLNLQDSLMQRIDRRIDLHLDAAQAALLKLSCLLRAAGRSADPSAAHRTPGPSSQEGRHPAAATAGVGLRLKLSNQERRFLECVHANANSPFDLFRAQRTARPAPKTVTRFFMEAGEYTPWILLRAIAEAEAGKGRLNARFRPFAEALIREFFLTFRPLRAAPPLLSGKDLVVRFGLAPSPLLGAILAHIEELRLTGLVSTRAEALAAAEKFLVGWE